MIHLLRPSLWELYTVEMKLQVSEIIETYSLYASIASPISAVLLPGCSQDTFSIHSRWTTRDLQRSELTHFSRNHVCLQRDGSLQFISANLPEDVNSESLTSFSSSGTKKAVLRQTVEKGEKVQYLEIWNSRSKIKTIPVKDLKSHGKIYDDGEFGCLSWSPNEELLLYVAETKQPKYESFFERNASCDTGDSVAESLGEKVEKGEQHLFREDWGEALVGKHHSVVCVLDVNTGHVKVFPLGDNISAGQAIWICDKTVVCVGWQEDPRRLGLKYCTNRKSDLYRISLETGDSVVLFQTRGCPRSPQYNSDKNILLFIDNQYLGPHRQGNRLLKVDWETGEEKVVVDTVDNPSDDAFPGLYVDHLPERCWSEDGSYVFLSSLWRAQKRIIAVNIVTGDVEALDIGYPSGSCTVLDVKNNVILVSASSPSVQPYLVAGLFSCGCDSKISTKWIPVDGVPDAFGGLKSSIISLAPSENNENKKYPGIKYEAVLLSPESTNESVPLIVWPHGGPHSAFISGFDLYRVAFAKLGFVVCCVNYRGSVGYGENSIKSLLGNIGTQDVKDVQFAVESVMERDDMKIGQIALFGGSHGGFLVTHLSGQYPDFYNACVCRNPVIDISGMVESTDIPEWSWVETGVGDEFGFAKNPDPQLLSTMWTKSPICYMKNVKVPTLILLGKNDLRVPPSQGKKYYYHLRARNVPVRMYVFDDNHALSTVAVEGESFVQIVLWLKEHLS